MDGDNTFSVAAWCLTVLIVFGMMTTCAVRVARLCTENGYATDCRVVQVENDR